MLTSLLSGMQTNPTMAIVNLLLLIPALLIALTIHEYSHGRMALALGDKTALMSGRLSLNPIHHLDPIGALMLLLFGFGFAKPVPVNMRNVTKVSYKTGTILISLAGPLSNLLLAFLGVLGYHIVFTIAINTQSYPIYLQLTQVFFEYFALLNVGLAVFNLIPIPPLDGSRILTIFLPAKAQMWFYRYEQIIQLAIFALLWLGILDRPLFAARSAVMGLFEWLVSFIPFLV